MKKTIILVLSLLLLTSATFAAAYQIQEARTLYSKGDYNTALKTVSEAIKTTSKNDVAAYTLRAEIYEKMNKTQEAINDLTTAIKLNSNNVSLYMSRGELYYSLEKYEDAINDFIKGTMNFNNTQAFDRVKKMVDDEDVPLKDRVNAAIALCNRYDHAGKDFIDEYTMSCIKMIQIIASADPNDEFFDLQSKTDKLNNVKSGVQKNLASYSEDGNATSIIEHAKSEIFYGYVEYAMGDKAKGQKIAKGAIKEFLTRYPEAAAYSISLQQFSGKLKNVLDYGLSYNGQKPIMNKVDNVIKNDNVRLLRNVIGF